MAKYISIICSILILSSCARPIPYFNAVKNAEVAPVKVKFDNTSQKSDSYLWDFGDGSTSEEISPEHKYYLSGNYKVTLHAKKGSKSNKLVKEILVEAPLTCMVEMETSEGTLTIELSDLTPKHRDNFIKLAEEGFYEGTLFHRVIKGFMVQGGDPESKNAAPGKRLGSGGPGYTIDAEITSELAHVKGALAAARQGDGVNPLKKSSGSQFYIVDGRSVDAGAIDMTESQKGILYNTETKQKYLEHGGTPFLDQEYTVFGHVVDGLDVIDRIAATPTEPGDRPKEDVIIMKMRVIK